MSPWMEAVSRAGSGQAGNSTPETRWSKGLARAVITFRVSAVEVLAGNPRHGARADTTAAPAGLMARYL
jgi:hypothetical protein